MLPSYINRQLRIVQSKNERVVAEAELTALGFPLILLGDPGMGKTRLTETLATAAGGVRVTGGAFIRTPDPSRFLPSSGKPLIIDGLDEIASSSGIAAVDAVLTKLGEIGYPDFVLSCRAADWSGALDRHKINEDYGQEPITAHLLPLSRSDAYAILEAYDDIDADDVLVELDRRDLGEFYANPLTLILIAEVVRDGQGLPNSRADLLERASKLLVYEQNRAHLRSSSAMASGESLLSAAGAIFSLILLSGCSGVADLPENLIPAGYIGIGELGDIANGLQSAALKTRLFRSSGENLFQPYHRVIAEYIAARWLSYRIASGLSERRVLQAVTFAGGVPTPLRGLHAWLGHFTPTLTAECIKGDPYGFLRYSDAGHLPLTHARLLLNSLNNLANEDPYFRSEDWGRRSMVGLARPELKSEILTLLRHPDRHIHLSTVVLEALKGSELTIEIVSELQTLMVDKTAAYVERYNAAEALIAANVFIDWPTIIRTLANNEQEDRRLALEILGLKKANDVSGPQVADLLLDYHGAFNLDSNHEYVSGSDYVLLRELSPTLADETLNTITARLSQRSLPLYWNFGHRMASAMHRLISKALQQIPPPSAGQIWCWLKMVRGNHYHFNDEYSHITDLLSEQPDLRQSIQRFAFSNRATDETIWKVIASDLPMAHRELAINHEDAALYINEIAQSSEIDFEFFRALVRVTCTEGNIPQSVAIAANHAIAIHPQLQEIWNESISPPVPDWEKEQKAQSRRAEVAREQRFQKTRRAHLKQKDGIATGVALGPLQHFARAYINHYSDLNNDAEPIERLREWLGKELTEAALKGFVQALKRNDLPTAKQIGDSRAENKEWTIEPLLIVGAAEILRTEQSLENVPLSVLKATLAAWWEFPDSYSERLGEKLGKELENNVLSSNANAREFLIEVMEPRIRASREHVPGLHRVLNDERFRTVIGELALKWLQSYRDANLNIQRDLLGAALQLSDIDDLRQLAIIRSIESDGGSKELRAIWMSVRFLIDFDASEKKLAEFCSTDETSLWTIRSLIRANDNKRWRHVSLSQLNFIVKQFAPLWPPANFPSDWVGDRSPWDATEFIRSALAQIGVDNSLAASDVLDKLAIDLDVSNYRDQIKHVRAKQQRLRRDTDYRVSSPAEVQALLSGSPPRTIDDLKAVVRDALADLQRYLRQGDTQAWKSCWTGDAPSSENTCRDRLLDIIKAYVSPAIALLPEPRMPEGKRADLIAIYNGNGIPMEFKGQWHKDVWDATSVQLIERYTKDWRADGRGIYIVLWFGDVRGRNLPKHPAGLRPPATPTELRSMLIDRLEPSERARVDIVVIDVSKP